MKFKRVFKLLLKRNYYPSFRSGIYVGNSGKNLTALQRAKEQMKISKSLGQGEAVQVFRKGCSKEIRTRTSEETGVRNDMKILH